MAVMLTTIDNPFDPFIEWDEWFQWDTHAGYNTCGLLARFVNTSSELSEEDQLKDIERAIDSIIELNFDGVYKKIEKQD